VVFFCLWASAERDYTRDYNGSLRAETSAGSRGRSSGQGFRGVQSPPEAESFLSGGPTRL